MLSQKYVMQHILPKKNFWSGWQVIFLDFWGIGLLQQ